MISQDINHLVISYKSKNDIPTLLFSIIWTCGFVYKLDNIKSITKYEFDNVIFLTLGLIITIFLLYKTIWILTGRLTIEITNDKLYKKKYLMGIHFSSDYSIRKIKKPSIVQNSETNTYWGFNGLR